MRPDVGTQPAFKKKKPPVTYRYDSSPSPALDWDGQNPARERARRSWLSCPTTRRNPCRDGTLVSSRPFAPFDCGGLEVRRPIDRLKAMSRPFLNWAGKAERLSFDVPTLPLFVHERLSTKAIVETLSGHRDESPQETMLDLFGDPHHSIIDQILKAYEYRDNWVNRMILGDSLVVMNSLLHFENLGGQVQMIYMDPPYGIKYGSNFQPFIRKRECEPWRRRRHDPRTRDGPGLSRHMGNWTAFLPDVSARPRCSAREMLTRGFQFRSDQ